MNNIQASEQIHKKILTAKQVKEISKVKDLLFNPETNKIEYIVTDSGNWFEQDNVISFDKIEQFGDDRIIVTDASAEFKLPLLGSKLNTLVRDDDIINQLNIITEDGKKLGKVSDFYFDESGKITQFEISQGIISDITTGKNTLQVTQIKKVGEDAIIVSTDTQKDFKNENKENNVLVNN